ncbi:MAG: hypothetical protein V4598_01615 [Bdellovibrionota bacterium]
MLTFVLSAPAIAQTSPREIAWKLHNRIAGVPPRPTMLASMEAEVAAGRPEVAANMALANPNFINITMKNWVKSWSNREQSNRADFNDHSATLIGIIRDDIPFDQALYGDIYYTIPTSGTAWANNSNAHYRAAEQSRLNFADAAVLVREAQSARLLPANAVSGVITTRQSGEAFFQAGTNRRINRFTFMNFLCNDYEQIHDVTVPTYHIGRDVERTPGGDSRTFLNKCVGCHAGQDGLRGAYAYYDYSNNMITHTPGAVVAKINRNNLYSSGKITVNDSWENLWALPGTQNQNKLVFKGAVAGVGAKSLNQMLARSEGFSNCMAKKVFELVCMKEPVNADDKAFVAANARRFESTDAYSMKKLIVKTSVGCIANE